jgi:hypothetical protein
MQKKEQIEFSNKKYDEFGCIPVELTIKAGDYKIFPGTHFQENITKIYNKYINKDNFMYPPEVETWDIDPMTEKKKKKIPNTKRPANLHRSIPTHLIHRFDGNDLPNDFRTNDGALILRLIDVLYETTTQYYDWWWSGRVYINKAKFNWLREKDIATIFELVFPVWDEWNNDTKKVFLNCAFNFSRSRTYEWDYERFTFLYICIDAIWWIAKNQYDVKCLSGKQKGGHAKRIDSILAHFDLYQNPTIVKSIVDIRNDLFHQGLWGIANPMSGKDDVEYRTMRYLHEIVRRCILRIIGIQSLYIKSNWESYLGRQVWEN